ncbi:Dihydrolipoamide acyltransferase component of branched-chain alpha-keto acid dehydrogenase complex [Pseudomonas sp. XWY-1]|jgi:2-oxoisovalerate dehydrogenase E2 component (dihydrolipoyl transacylase)|uniref:Dihydrolipoamide acetyltransferase component of pyruvate dehydrogenase complex n=7 Tax=Pseudomonas TaxID=286 RepID=Q88EQ0_PSEPK|nr:MULTISPECIES: dihydrolipoamide acetyltransferase family protein [Pseudomonas]AAN69981.1 Lipoamide acyltransferase component of branched-chain alpha-keto acid dehydrogenase complex [Pseudomonas putida KT2440]AFK71096.1 branched-chain alpha-keto acid dehydrogenase subunit E2 [Pseudomonas putida ND6]AFO50925.1 Lipoamide acyltransferase component of [Pseudomonas putida DOT-T1E]ANI02424.1 branched-chain alpha-keto acid dehydrogenase subunit E2 [Pseudomonas putida SJTE-1]AUZ58128.1 Dihydrolipoami
MGTHVIKMPDIGEGIAQVELVEWFVKVGDIIAEDQVVADVMTDKATVEIPSPVSGKVLALGGQPGEVMAVGSELIRIEVEGSGNHVDVPQPKPVEAPAAPIAAKPEPQKDVKPAVYQAPANHEAAPIVPRQPGDKPLASPAVRKRALDAGIELRYVHGSGPAGRILHEDLDAFMSKPQSNAGQAPDGYAKRTDSEQVPVIGLRRKIAQRMQDAKRRVAHFSYVEEIDVTALEALRQQLNSKHGDSRGKLTLLPFLVRALVVALRDFPQINATYDDEAQIITRHGAVHVGIATQGDNGLMVPVLRHAEAGSLWANAGEISRLANAARNNKASREELSGSTITLTSLGALGGIVSTPVVNTPEVAIVGVNRMVERPVVIDGQIVVRKMMNLSSSFDHRVVDGMDAALFIQAVRGLLEQPACLFVE